MWVYPAHPSSPPPHSLSGTLRRRRAQRRGERDAGHHQRPTTHRCTGGGHSVMGGIRGDGIDSHRSTQKLARARSRLLRLSFILWVVGLMSDGDRPERGKRGGPDLFFPSDGGDLPPLPNLKAWALRRFAFWGFTSHPSPIIPTHPSKPPPLPFPLSPLPLPSWFPSPDWANVPTAIHLCSGAPHPTRGARRERPVRSSASHSPPPALLLFFCGGCRLC